MPKEYLRGVIFLRRLADSKDFNELVNCVPDSRMAVLEAGLKQRADEGEIDTVQIARTRTDIHPLSPVYDGIDAFFAKLDAVRLKPQEECPECGRPYSSMDRATASEAEDPGSIPGGASNPHISEIRHSEFIGFDDVNETGS